MNPLFVRLPTRAHNLHPCDDHRGVKACFTVGFFLSRSAAWPDETCLGRQVSGLYESLYPTPLVFASRWMFPPRRQLQQRVLAPFEAAHQNHTKAFFFFFSF